MNQRFVFRCACKITVLTGVLVISTLSTPFQRIAAEENRNAEATKFFENKIRPLLSKHCLECHGPNKKEGGLRLDSESAFRKGGESGLVFDDQEPDKSLLIEAIRHEGLEMPPKGKISDDEIELIEVWLRGGAFWPEHSAPIVEGKGKREFTEQERAYWFYQPMKVVNPPSVKDDSDVKNPIDLFLRARQREVGIEHGPIADRRTLARRAFFDVLGVPPSWDEIQEFENDPSPDAFERLVDRLLDDPRYGQRWARYWLDLVRYAESDGYKADDFRPTAYRYRDYVVRSFNQDKPYAQFVTEQIAGDELDPESLEMLDATSFLRLWIYEYNQRDVEGQWSAILNDITDVTGEVFMGMSIGCARCHDHKFDPILQKDYYRLQAFFASLIPRDDLASASKDEIARFRAKMVAWESKTEAIRRKLDAIETPIRTKTIADGIEKFPPAVRPALSKDPDSRSPREKQLAHLAFLQVQRDIKAIDFKKRLKGETLESWMTLQEELDALKGEKPAPLPIALAMRDVGRTAADVFVPGKGSEIILPGIVSILSEDPLPIRDIPERDSTGRRTAFANWLTDSENPFLWRVVVNRVWQHHFGRGLVENASDLGKLTQPPSHPELLDWLARWFVDHRGSWKQLHRLIMTSQAYQQQAFPEGIARNAEIDPLNRYLWRFQARRLDAEQIRDSMLAVTGELHTGLEGPSVDAKSFRRAIYRRAMRNSPDSLLQGFDGPDGSSSTAKRSATTTSLQALMLMNSSWTLERAKKLAARVIAESDEEGERIALVFQHGLGRAPSPSEMSIAKDFLSGEGTLSDFCHVVLSSNEFFFWE